MISRGDLFDLWLKPSNSRLIPMALRTTFCCLMLIVSLTSLDSASQEADPGAWFLEISQYVSEEKMLLALDMDLGKEVQILSAQLDRAVYEDQSAFRRWALMRYEVLQLQDALIKKLEVPAQNELAISVRWRIAEMRAETYDWEYSQSFPFTDNDIAVAMVRDIFLTLEKSRIDLTTMYNLATWFFAEFEGKYSKDALYHFNAALVSLRDNPPGDRLKEIDDYAILSLREIEYLELIGDSKEATSHKEAFDTWINRQYLATASLHVTQLIAVWNMISKFINGNESAAHEAFIAIRKQIYLSLEPSLENTNATELLPGSLKIYSRLLTDAQLDEKAGLASEAALYWKNVILSNDDVTAFDALIALQANALDKVVALQDLNSLVTQLASFKFLIHTIERRGLMGTLNAESLFEIKYFKNDPTLNMIKNILLCYPTAHCLGDDSIYEYMVDNREGSLNSYFQIAPLIWNDQSARARQLFNTHFMGKDFTDDCGLLMAKAGLSLDFSRFSYLRVRQNPGEFNSTLPQIVKDIDIAREAYAKLAKGDPDLQDSCTANDGRVGVKAPILEAYTILLGLLWGETLPSDHYMLSEDLNELQYMRVRSVAGSVKFKEVISGIDSLLITGFKNLLLDLGADSTDSSFESKVRANQDIVDRFVLSCAQTTLLDNSASCVSYLPVAHSLKTYSSRSNHILVNSIKANAGISGTGDAMERMSEMYEESTLLEAEMLNVGPSEGIFENLRRLNRRSVILEGDILLERESINTTAPSIGVLLESRLVSLKSIQRYMKADEVLMFTFPKIWGFSQDFYVIGIIESNSVRVKVINAHNTDKRISRILDTVSQIAPYDYESAYAVYNEIFDDVINDGNVGSVKTDISFIGADMLDSIPLRMLVTDNPEGADFTPSKSWLYQKFDLKRSTTLRQFLSGRMLSKKNKRLDTFLGVGNPYLASSNADLRGLKLISQDGNNHDVSRLSRLPSLPDTEMEIRELSKYYADEPQSMILLGKTASEANIKSLDIKQYGTIAFATHGLLSGDVAGLEEPALLLTPPKKSSANDDGLLTAGEISEMDMRANLVILSACNTNVEDMNSGSALSNLSSAFMLAGASSIMATHWSVETNVATFITTRTVARLRVKPSEGLAGAMNHAIGLARQRPEWQHPFFWAPFSVYGDNALIN